MNKIANIIDQVTAQLAHDNREAERVKVVDAARESRLAFLSKNMNNKIGREGFKHTLSCGCVFDELGYTQWPVECDRHRRPVLIYRIPAGVDVTDGGRYTAD